MKWFKLAPVLALAVALIGCGKNEGDVSTNGDADSTMMAAQKNKDKADNNNEGEYDPVGDLAREENKLFESENSKTRYAALEEASDYISLVELSSDAGGGVSLKFIKNYKGALSTIELKTPKSLTPNQEYIVFYRDTAEGDVRPTHDTYAFYKVDGSDDELLRYFEKKYDDRDTAKEEETSSKDKDKDTVEAGSSSKRSTTDKDAADTKSSTKKSTKSGSSSSGTTSSSGTATGSTATGKKTKSTSTKSTSTKGTGGSSNSKKQSTKRSTDLEN